MNSKQLIKSYISGFILSLVLTLTAYGLTLLHVNSYHQFISHEVLIPGIIGLAVVQLVVQLVFFLHLAHEKKPHWNLTFLISTVGLILLVVVASIWIMDHLNHNMTPQQMNTKILQEEGIHY